MYRYQYTPSLHIACERGRLDIVKSLIEEHNFNKEIDDCGYSPLDAACSGGHLDVVKYLIEKQNLDVEKNHNCAPLHFACDLQHLDIVQICSVPRAKRGGHMHISSFCRVLCF